MRSDADRLSGILEAIAKIRDRTMDTIDAFRDDEMLQVWVIHHPQVIGEAARSVSQSLNNCHPEVPWPQIIALSSSRFHPWPVNESRAPDLYLSFTCNTGAEYHLSWCSEVR
jgi:uncharacterized protein with HEPN domain